ncbi:MAG: type I-B CRISPR-associated protein Cas8b1/Cst1, partial [Candidatus Aminicenantes bacterium]|nr:type I-B CRISPR-associated protein Cas8b1/Cst1 [Candidatus Aminicenantes bacterium]
MDIEGNKKIRIEIKDWLYNAGIVGLCRVLKEAGVPVLQKDNYIEVDESAFDGFEKSFFNYFSETYKQNSLWYRLTGYYDANFQDGIELQTDDEVKKKIADFASNFSSELDRASYKTAYEIITGDKDFIKEKTRVIKDKNIEPGEKLDKIAEIYDFFKKNKDLVQAKYVSYAVINNYWEGVSFLNKQQVKKNMFDLFKNDFVMPVLKFFQEPGIKKRPIHCRVCNREINSRGEAFEGLSWIKMDLDSARKTSVYWNYNTDIIICPVCHLVYACVPAGFVTARKRGIFLNYNTGIDRLIELNSVIEERLRDIENLNELENIG